jgi:hypothetical protein
MSPHPDDFCHKLAPFSVFMELYWVSLRLEIRTAIQVLNETGDTK